MGDAEKDAKFSTFWPPLKITGGVGEISELRFLALPTLCLKKRAHLETLCNFVKS